jgi:cyclopropane fatty-acyl-phospholipid synthase-like methyltransferase
MTMTEIELFYDKMNLIKQGLVCVISFLNEFKKGSKVLDIGCGNGKYMNYRNDIIMKGIDISINLVEICKKKGFDVTKATMTIVLMVL